MTEVRCGKSVGRGRVCGKLLGVVGPDGWEDRDGWTAADHKDLLGRGHLLPECPRHGYRSLLKVGMLAKPTVLL